MPHAAVNVQVQVRRTKRVLESWCGGALDRPGRGGGGGGGRDGVVMVTTMVMATRVMGVKDAR